MTTLQETLQDFRKSVRESIEERRARRRQQASKIADNILVKARAMPYAALGSTAQTLERGRKVASDVFGLPGRLLDGARHAPDRLSEAFDVRAERGRRIVSRVTGRNAVQKAAHQYDSARSRSRAATTSVRKAAKATAEAIEEAAEAAFDHQDTRPYEERTLEELRSLASERRISGRSGMNKAALIEALRAHR